MCRLLFFFFFFFNDTATTEIYTLSLHDALPIFDLHGGGFLFDSGSLTENVPIAALTQTTVVRSEEHTSELQSHLNLVCRLLLEKKKTGRREPLLNSLTDASTWIAPCLWCDPIIA